MSEKNDEKGKMSLVKVRSQIMCHVRNSSEPKEKLANFSIQLPVVIYRLLYYHHVFPQTPPHRSPSNSQRR